MRNLYKGSYIDLPIFNYPEANYFTSYRPDTDFPKITIKFQK